MFADLGLENPNALLAIADARIEWNETLKEPLPKAWLELLERL